MSVPLTISSCEIRHSFADGGQHTDDVTSFLPGNLGKTSTGLVGTT